MAQQQKRGEQSALHCPECTNGILWHWHSVKTGRWLGVSCDKCKYDSRKAKLRRGKPKEFGCNENSYPIGAIAAWLENVVNQGEKHTNPQTRGK